MHNAVDGQQMSGGQARGEVGYDCHAVALPLGVVPTGDTAFANAVRRRLEELDAPLVIVNHHRQVVVAKWGSYRR